MTLSLPLWTFALLPVVLFPAALFWGAPAIAALNELLGLITHRPFPGRTARHVSRLGLWGHGLFWLGILVIGLQGNALWISAFGGSNRLLLTLAMIALLCGTALFVVYDQTWKQAGKRKWLHFALGCVANMGIKCGYWGLVATWLFLPRPVSGYPTVPVAGTWLLVSLWLPLSLCLSASLGLCYLLWRRGRDDWGRDYYRFAAPFLAKWYLVTGLISLFCLVGLFVSLHGVFNLYLPQIFYPALGSVFCLSVAMSLAFLVQDVENPLRLKGSMCGVAVLSGLFGLLLVAAILETLNHYVAGWAVPTFMPHLLALFR